MGVLSDNAIIGASAAGGYDIDYSLRCDGGTSSGGANGSSAYLSRTVSSGTGDSQRKFTLSCWIKLAANANFSTDESLTPYRVIYSWADGNGDSSIGLHNTNITTSDPDVCLMVESHDNGGNRYYKWLSTSLIRDPSQWYHLVVAIDTTQASLSDRIKAWLNNEQITSWGTQLNPTQNQNVYINGAGHVMLTNWIGATWRAVNSTVWKYWDGYIAEMHALDGIIKAPSDFAEADPVTNEWKAIKYIGAYGTTGIYLKFDDSSALGKDSSGNGNNFTVTNFIVTDQVIDTPQNSTGGNFATINSIRPPQNPNLQISGNTAGTNSTSMLITEGNLQWQGNNPNYYNNVVGTIGLTSGKWYWEVYNKEIDAVGWLEARLGVISIKSQAYFARNTLAHDTKGTTYYKAYDGKIHAGNGTGTSDQWAYGATYGDGTIIGMALNMDDGQITYYKNNVAQNSGTPFSFSSMTQPYDITAGALPWFAGIYSQHKQLVNFGQDSSFAGNKIAQGNMDVNNNGDFYYTPPSGYLAVCSNNLSDPSVKMSEENFNPIIWSGTGGNRDFTDVGFQPDLVWQKARDDTWQWNVTDSVRGVGKALMIDAPSAQDTNSANGYIDAFLSNGFSTIAGASNNNWWNDTTDTFAAWSWKAGGAPTATNSAGAGNVPTAGSVKINGANLGSALAGTIPATKQTANSETGFSITTFTGTGATGTVAHGLSQAPEIFVVKDTSVTAGGGYDWLGWNVGLPGAGYILNWNTNGASTADSSIFTTNNPPTTASIIHLGSHAYTNSNGNEKILYAWHSVEGYSKIGNYGGSSYKNGPFVYTGFRPAFVWMKRIENPDNYLLFDDARDPFNVAKKNLRPDVTVVEATGAGESIDMLSNGFKLRGDGDANNGVSQTYIYMAFAEYPFKYSRAR